MSRDRDPEDVAAEYLREGWAVVPVRREDKRPVIRDWPTLAERRDFKPYDFRDSNVGVVLGPVSGDLVDIDLDSAAAIELAPYFLPETRTFGRRSKRQSHWLYYCKGIRSDALAFGPRPERGSGKKRELIEIRAQNLGDDNCSHQSVFPGSVHESGERIEWDDERANIETVGAGDLAWRVARLAVAATLLPDWAEGSHRNAKSFGVSGGLLKAGWRADEVRDLLQAVRECSGADRDEDASAVERTIEAFAAGKDVQGFGSLLQNGEIEEHTHVALSRHSRTPTTRALETQMAASRLGRHGAQAALIEEARAVDGMTAAANVPAQIVALTPVRRRRKDVDEDRELGSLGREVDYSEPAEPLDYICKGLQLAPGKVTGIGGYGGTGKGPLALWMALHLAAGLPVFGHEVKRSAVFYADFETGHMTHVRMQRMARVLDLDLGQLRAERWLTYVDSGGRRFDDDWLDDLDELIDELGVRAVFLDSYSSGNRGLDMNDSIYADAAWALGDISSRRGCTILPVFHENKGREGRRGDDDARALAGTQQIYAAVQGLISIVRPDPQRKQRYEVRSTRAPETPFNSFTIEWHDVPEPGRRSTGARVAGLSQGEDPARWGLEPRMVESEAAPTGARGERSLAISDADMAIAKRVVAYMSGAETGGKRLTQIRNSARGGNMQIKNVVAGLVADGILTQEYDLYELAPVSRGNSSARIKWGL